MTAVAPTVPPQSWAQVARHILRDFVQDLKGEARDAFGGWFWHLILPLAPLGVYLALATFRVFSHPDGITAATYMTVGATLWLLFSGLVYAPMSALRSKGKLAAQTGYPLIGMVLAKVLSLVFDTAIRLVMVGAILAWQQPPAAPLLALAAMLGAAPLFLGAGIIFALFAAAIRDLDRIVPLVLQYTFFLSFAIFPIPLHGEWIALNPFATFVDNVRHLLVFGILSAPLAYAGWCAVGLLMLIKALRFLGRAERIVIGHL